MHRRRQVSRFEAVALSFKEGQNRLRRRTASGDLLAPDDLLRTRSFFQRVAFLGRIHPGKRSRYDERRRVGIQRHRCPREIPSA